MLINVCLWSKRATSYRIYESQNGLSELLQATYITAIKTESLNFFTCFTEVKTDSPNLYKLPTRFAVALTTLRESTNILHSLPWSKRIPQFSTVFLYTLGWSKRILRVSTRLIHALRWLCDLLQASYTLCCNRWCHLTIMQMRAR